MKRSRIFLLLALLTAGVVLFVAFFLRDKAVAPAQNNAQSDSRLTPTEVPAEEITKQAFNKQKYSLSTPGSIWLIVNKSRPIPESYVPDLIVPNVKLRLSQTEQQMKFSKQAAAALEEMFAAAKKDGVTLVFGSGYRSYALQKQFYDGYVARDGQAAADRYSARPGTSEHQIGLSFDATSASGKCHLEICFEDTPEGKWLAAHADKYGFTLRYKNGKEGITGYQYEPWHFRYVGSELSAELNKTNQTLEEFFDLN